MSAPTVVVYCTGPANAPHDRFVVAAYQRTHDTPTSLPALWQPLELWDGMRLRNTEHSRYDDSGWRLAYRFRCDRCKYDQRRSWDGRNVDDALYGAFDLLWGHGKAEVPVRELIRHIDRALKSQT